MSDLRKLASVRKISKLDPIEGKDRIELAFVDGWSVIVKKGEFNVGDMCVYIEIDSVLPEKPEFEFLRSKHFHIKTMKMGGVVSQGICFPMSILPQNKTYSEGDDLTDVIGVKHYELTIDDPIVIEDDKKHNRFLMRFAWYRKLVLGPKFSTAFPSQVKKTDEFHIQNAPHYLNNDCIWVATEKVDGCSATYVLTKKMVFPRRLKYGFTVASRNRSIPESDKCVYNTVAKTYNIMNVMKNMIHNHSWIAIQGEIIDTKVQGNKYKVTYPHFYVFNIITPEGRVSPQETQEMCKWYGLTYVPVIDWNVKMPDTVEEVIAMSNGESKISDTTPREGIVFRSLDGKLSFKAVSPEFLMKWKS